MCHIIDPFNINNINTKIEMDISHVRLFLFLHETNPTLELYKIPEINAGKLPFLFLNFLSTLKQARILRTRTILLPY